MLKTKNSRIGKSLALLSATAFVSPTILAGCGAVTDPPATTPPPGMDRPASQPRTQPNQGMSTRKKLAILAGAAALYYIYNKRKAKAAQEAGPTGKYFLSESTGRV